MRSWVLGSLLLLAACGAPTPLALVDGGPRPLMCTTPQRIDLVAPTSGSNAGIPMAGIAWPSDRCVLTNDEHASGMVLLIADFTGTIFGAAGLSAAAGSRWAIDTSSTGGGPTTSLTNLPRDTDVTVAMHGPSDGVSITFRVEGNTLVLVDMHRT